jgi:hypothetical protein
MAGVSTIIVPQILLGVGASAILYLYTGQLAESNLCFVSTRDIEIHLADGFGRNQSAATVPTPVPYTIADEPPVGVYISTGGRTYQSMPKKSGVSVTTIAVVQDRCGPWLEIVVANKEASEGVLTLLGEV